MIYRMVIIGDPIYSPESNKPKKVKKGDLNLTPLLSDNLGNKTYLVSFIINSSLEGKLEKVSFKKAILDNISTYDKKYMELKSFTRKKAIFHLRTKKFIDDSLRGVRPTTVLTSFSKIYRLKRRWPDMITNDILKNNFVNFVIYHFKNYVNKNRRGLLKFF